MLFEHETKINESGEGVVKINRNVSLESGVIKLSNEESFINGNFHGGEQASLVVANGAAWDIPDVYNWYYHGTSNKGNTTIDNNGTVSVPVGMYVNLSTLSGTGGIFKFNIAQDAPNSGKISAGSVWIDRNVTEDAHHTIRLSPTQADFALTNDVKVTPFALVHDKSAKNNGYAVDFGIENFDAGAYNYTPTLTSETTANETTWSVSDIRRTGDPSEPEKEDEKDKETESEDNTKPSEQESGKEDEHKTTPSEQDGRKEDEHKTIPSEQDGGKEDEHQTTPSKHDDGKQSGNDKSDEKTTPSGQDDGIYHNGSGNSGTPVLSNLSQNTQGAAVNTYFHWRNEYNNLTKRLGDLRYAEDDDGAWARFFRGREESGRYGTSGTYNGYQVGYDHKTTLGDGDTWFFGGAVTVYDGTTGYSHSGYSKNRSTSLALYASYLGTKGHYLDVIARQGRLSSDLTSYAAGTGAKLTGDYHAWATSIGVEYGRRIPLKDGYFIQPEAELIYGHVGEANYTMSDDSRIWQGSVNAWTVRGGLRIGRKVEKTSFYVGINFIHDFGGESRMRITDKYGASHSEQTSLNDTRWTASIGGNVKLSDNTYCYGEVEKSFGGDMQTKWQYNLGIRVEF